MKLKISIAAYAISAGIASALLVGIGVRAAMVPNALAAEALGEPITETERTKIEISSLYAGVAMELHHAKLTAKVPDIQISTAYRADEAPNEDTGAEASISMSAEVVQTAEVQHVWTQQDAEAIAKTVWGEARGCGKMQQAGVAWCILNRFDAGFETSIQKVVAAHDQFMGYNPGFPVTDEILALTYDVLGRWEAEKAGTPQSESGRVLPPGYFWFTGDGEVNWFRDKFVRGKRWDWSLPNPYES